VIDARAFVAGLLLACAAPMASAPREVAIVPGCPTEADGSLSRCLARRTVWAHEMWARGRVRWFITSGAATYNRYAEADAIALGLVRLGVPACRIWLDDQARHTDENMYYSMLIAERLGLRDLSVASDGGQARGGCSFLASWTRDDCEALELDEDVVGTALDGERGEALSKVRVPPVEGVDWLPVFEWEARREAGGGPARPGSLALYFFWAPLGRLFGAPWIPAAPEARPLENYEALMARREGRVPAECSP
jgi:hypothetical protein